MSQTIDSPLETPVVQEKSSRGCLYGCLAAFAFMILVALCGGFAAYYFYNAQIQKYTSETPKELPAVEFTPEQLIELDTRLETFKSALDGAQPSEDLVLTADEINAMINREEQLRGKAFVRIEEGQITGDLSVPTDAIPGADGRFFNASGTFSVELENGVLVVTLTDAEVKGEKVPEEILNALRQENLAKDVYKDPKNAEMIRRFESVRVEDDKIIFKLRRKEELEKSAGESENSGAPESGSPNTESPERDSDPHDRDPGDSDPSDDEVAPPKGAEEESVAP